MKIQLNLLELLSLEIYVFLKGFIHKINLCIMNNLLNNTHSSIESSMTDCSWNRIVNYKTFIFTYDYSIDI